MSLSQPTQQLLEDLIKFSGSKIKNKEDLGILLEASLKNEQERLLNDLTFTAKYLNGLGKILRDNIIPQPVKGVSENKLLDEPTAIKIRDEFKEHIQKLILQLTAMTKDINEPDRNKIEEKYLTMTRASMINITSLIYDLSWLKKYYNSKQK
jgi:hypothetical protein